MNLELRAWDKYNKKMEYGDKVSFWDDFKDMSSLNKLLMGWTRKQYELMLYICKKDKNKRKIFESDIVKHENGIHVVEYWEDSVSFQMGLSNFVLDQEIGDYDNIEIIGNIYENPELFKKGEVNG